MLKWFWNKFTHFNRETVFWLRLWSHHHRCSTNPRRRILKWQDMKSTPTFFSGECSSVHILIFFKCVLYIVPSLYTWLFAYDIWSSAILPFNHPQQLSMDGGLIALNRCEVLVQWLALTNTPSFTQTNQRVLQAEEQSRNKSLDRMKYGGSLALNLYKAARALEVRNVWRAVCIIPYDSLAD